MTFGNVKADVLADKDPKSQRMNFCCIQFDLSTLQYIT